MVATLVLGAGLFVCGLGDPGAVDPAKPPARVEYEAKNANVGRDSQSHVRLALWCEQNGFTAERAKHLALAVLIDPKNTMARGLSGVVAYQGSWKRPESISEKVKADAALGAKLAEYNERRERVGNNADAQWKLALWCEEQGLDAEARAHFTTVVRLEPSREAAWKKLGCKRVGKRWVTEKQLADEKAEFEAQKAADKTWRPLLRKWHTAWVGKSEKRRAEAEAALNAIEDPRAVPVLWDVFARGDEGMQTKVVEVLGRIDGEDASRGLAVLAVFSRSPEVRRTATETLRRRDMRDVAGWLIALIRKPSKYEVRPVGGPGSPGALFVEGQRFNLGRLYSPPPLPNIPIFPGEPVTFDAYGLPVITRLLPPSVVGGTSLRETTITPAQFFGNAPTDPATQALIAQARGHTSLTMVGRRRSPIDKVTSEGFIGNAVITETTTSATPMDNTVQIPIGQLMMEYEASAWSSERQLENDVAMVEKYNASVRESNDRVTQVLRDFAGQDFGSDVNAWSKWWADQQGYAFNPPRESPKPTVVQNVPPALLPQGVSIQGQSTQSGPTTTATSVTASVGHSCFRAGTLVRTLTGPRAIDSIEVGDRVLVEDTTSGEMRFEPVLAVYHNKPAALHKVDLGSESIWATGIHRFWKAGRGWVMARDLKPGDRVRTLGGTETVLSVEEGPVEPVFNLEVGGGQSFFVALGALVHDNSLVRAVSVPFDAADASAR